MRNCRKHFRSEGIRDNLLQAELKMSTIPQYSSLFSCLYDEANPVGSLGRGTHYSVFRSVEWLDVIRQPLTKPQVHDFAVIWDEDHDTRVIDVIEQIYMAGLLSPIQFVGERKGMLHVIVASRFYYIGSPSDTEEYRRGIATIAQGLEDPWSLDLGMFDRSDPETMHQCDYQGIIAAEKRRVDIYLRNIDSLWRLGTREFVRQRRGWEEWQGTPPLPPPPPLPSPSSVAKPPP